MSESGHTAPHNNNTQNKNKNKRKKKKEKNSNVDSNSSIIPNKTIVAPGLLSSTNKNNNSNNSKNSNNDNINKSNDSSDNNANITTKKNAKKQKHTNNVNNTTDKNGSGKKNSSNTVNSQQSKNSNTSPKVNNPNNNPRKNNSAATPITSNTTSNSKSNSNSNNVAATISHNSNNSKNNGDWLKIRTKKSKTKSKTSTTQPQIIVHNISNSDNNNMNNTTNNNSSNSSSSDTSNNNHLNTRSDNLVSNITIESGSTTNNNTFPRHTDDINTNDDNDNNSNSNDNNNNNNQSRTERSNAPRVFKKTNRGKQKQPAKMIQKRKRNEIQGGENDDDDGEDDNNNNNNNNGDNNSQPERRDNSFGNEDERGDGSIKGRFSVEEDKLILQAMDDYLRRENVALSENELKEKRLLLVTESKKHFKNAWQHIAAECPINRSSQSLYYRARRLLSEAEETAEWSPEEVAQLWRLIEAHGENWKLIASQLGRYDVAVRDKYRSLNKGNTKNSGTWTDEEERLLLRFVDEFNETSRNKSISWEYVATKMGNVRTAWQCRRHYFQTVEKKQSDLGRDWSLGDDLELITRIYDGGYEEESAIYWPDISVNFKFDHCKCKLRWIQLSRYGTADESLDHRLKYLMNQIRENMAATEIAACE